MSLALLVALPVCGHRYFMTATEGLDLPETDLHVDLPRLCRYAPCSQIETANTVKQSYCCSLLL
jgi:hypothetical protein